MSSEVVPGGPPEPLALPEGLLRGWTRPARAPVRLPRRGLVPPSGVPSPVPAGADPWPPEVLPEASPAPWLASSGVAGPWPPASQQGADAGGGTWSAAPDEEEVISVVDAADVVAAARLWKTSATLSCPRRSGVSRSTILSLSAMSSGESLMRRRGRDWPRWDPATQSRHAVDHPF